MLNTLKIWFVAIRPQTLIISICPILIAATLVRKTVNLNISTLLIILGSALFIQIGTNLANDYFDYKDKG